MAEGAPETEVRGGGCPQCSASHITNFFVHSLKYYVSVNVSTFLARIIRTEDRGGGCLMLSTSTTIPRNRTFKLGHQYPYMGCMGGRVA